MAFNLIYQSALICFMVIFAMDAGQVKGDQQEQQINWDQVYNQEFYDGWIQQLASQTYKGVNRTTISGANCIIPFLFRGQVWEDCFIVEGKSMCVAENLGLQECAPPVENQKQSVQQSFRMAMNGEVCEFPFEFNGQTYHDCVDVVGSKMCVANGMLQECKPVNKTVRTTIDGEDCIFPFDLLGKKYHDCTAVNNIQACLVEGGFNECAPLYTSKSTKNNDSSNNISKQAKKERYTIDGRTCQFPFQFMDQEYYNCNEFLGEEWCILQEDWVKCLPNNQHNSEDAEMVGSVINQISSQVHANSYSSIVEACSNISDLSMLMQSFLLCNLAPFLSNSGLEVTVFAPTNEAFHEFLQSRSISTEDIMNHPEEFYQLFLYHIVPEAIMFEHFKDDLILSTLQDDYQLSVQLSEGDVEIVGVHSKANITTPNIKAGAAIVHIIDTILIPFEFFPLNISQETSEQSNETSSSKDAIMSYKYFHNDDFELENLSMFMELAEVAEVQEVIGGDLEGITLLAPSNQAFQAFFDTYNSSYQDLAASDESLLKSIIQYHTVPLYLSWEDLSRKLVLPTLYDEKMLLVTHSSAQQNSITIRGIGSSAHIQTSGIQAGQGIIYVLDDVLWPFNQPETQNQGSEQDTLQGRLLSSVQKLLD
eukprot:TRINITY_DN12856_c0_g1_i5.p1 TRINITY_DN12856_c0_g1~~TRINITY_DN12856_c0_g1_i5.p1  ORF type:complete len:694 (-),score=88.89 TRINITY_DN12856_c0_g1_i5:104-2047(-)